MDEATLSICSRRSLEMRTGLSLSTSDTVAGDTPTAAAMSLGVPLAPPYSKFLFAVVVIMHRFAPSDFVGRAFAAGTPYFATKHTVNETIVKTIYLMACHAFLIYRKKI